MEIRKKLKEKTRDGEKNIAKGIYSTDLLAEKIPTGS